MKKGNDIWSLASKHLKKISEGSEASGFDRTAEAEQSTEKGFTARCLIKTATVLYFFSKFLLQPLNYPSFP